MYLCKHKAKSNALLLFFCLFCFIFFLLMRDFSKHDVLFNTSFLAGLTVLLGLQYKSQVLVEREGGSKKKFRK